MNKVRQILWESELTGISEKHRWLVNGFVVLFIGIISYHFIAALHVMVFLGPGLGEKESYEFANVLIFDRLALDAPLVVWLLAAMLTIVIFFRLYVMLVSYFGYEKAFGEKFPAHIIPVFMLINTVGVMCIPLCFALFGAIAIALGYDFESGWAFLENTVSALHQWVMTNIPTLVEMPAVLAVFSVYMVAGFAHYWFHRLGHEFRALWLLFHRHHHMSPNLTQMSTAVVFFAFPLFILFFIPYTLVFASISKLFYAEPLYVEIFIFNLFVMMSEIFGHSDVFYNKVKNNKLVRWAGMFFGNGIYHYMHHSARDEDAVIIGSFNKGKDRKVNMINMGGGFFFFWDKVFGTFKTVSEEKPDVGLIGRPELHMNPVRLAFSGIAQLIYELRMNKDFLTRLKILFGPSEYNPPISKDYAIK